MTKMTVFHDDVLSFVQIILLHGTDSVLPEFKFSVQDLISNCLWDGYLLKEAGMGQERDADCDAGLRAGTSDWECWSENGPSELSQVGLRCPGLYSPTSISQGT